MMKRFAAIMLSMILFFALGACVPVQKQDTLDYIGPDTAQNPSAEGKYNFDQLHNDTVDLFEETGAYAYITDLNINGSNEEKSITVKAECLDIADEEMAKYFASAVLRRINDAATVQDLTTQKSSDESFGSFWDRFSCDLKVYTQTEAAKENGTPVYELHHAAGEAFGLDPEITSYEEGYERGKEILQRNEE